MPQCRALENQIHVTLDGYYKPCCAFGEHSTDFSIADYTPQEYMNSQYIQNIKSSMDQGWHSGCESCRLNEQNRVQSVRQMYNFLCRNSLDIELLDLNLNNDCNLSCRMCNSIASSKWAELLGKPQKNKNSFEKLIKNLNQIKHIKYQGGEPFITREIESVLNFVADNGCDFSFSTNCTVFPKKHLEQLSKCKTIFATFSIDGIGPTNDYIRHGKTWVMVEKVFTLWQTWFENKPTKNFRSINTVVQAYNFHDLENVKNFAQNYKIRWNGLLIQDIPELTLNALPESYIKQYLNTVSEPYVKNYNFNYDLYLKLKKRTAEHDKLLGVDIKNYNPVLHKIFVNLE